jgi:hypothetical protein
MRESRFVFLWKTLQGRIARNFEGRLLVERTLAAKVASVIDAGEFGY